MIMVVIVIVIIIMINAFNVCILVAIYKKKAILADDLFCT